MKKQLLTIRMLLVVAMLCLGVNVTWADAYKQVLYSENFENASTPADVNWSGHTDANVEISTNSSYSSYGKFISGWPNGSGNRSMAGTLSFTSSGYSTSSLTDLGYVIEFDALIKGGKQNQRAQSEFIVTYEKTLSSTTNTYFTESDAGGYLFALSQKTNSTGEHEKIWYINDLDNETTTTATLDYDIFYHYKLVVTKTSVSYTISATGKSDITGSKTINLQAVPAAKQIYMLLGRNAAWFLFDNIEIYDYIPYSELYAEEKAPYDTKVESLDVAGQAYWGTYVTPVANVTDETSYNTAVAALSTTYIAAVKAQSTAGADMTDAMPTGNAGWTCNQGNGPATVKMTFTETYGASSAFVAGNIMSQTITGLPNGYYKVQFYGVVNAARLPSALTENTNGLAQAYANSTSEEITVYYQDDCTPSDYLQTIEAQVIDGSLTYGLKAKEGVTDAGNWAVAKIYKLTYLGTDKNTYTINAVAGEMIIKELATGSAWASDNYGTYVPKAVLYNAKYYVLDDEGNANLSNYYANYTMGAANEIKQIKYTLEESIVYYIEGENLNTNSAGAGLSNGAYGHVAGGAKTTYKGFSIGSFDSGVYQASAYFVSDNVSKNRGFYVRNTNLDNADDANVLGSTGTKSAGLYSTDPFILTESTPLSISGYTGSGDYAGKVNQSAEFDYIIVRKLESVSATITPTGYATFSSMCPLDFSKPIDNLEKVYYASAVAQGSVTMTELNQTVPANTGLFLKGKAGETITIPVVASGNALPGTNYLKPTTSSAITASANGIYHYVFAYNTNSDSYNAGFYNLSSDVTPGAGKAYIETTTDIKPSSTPQAKVNFMLADGGLTGVKNIDASSNINANTGKIYNLGGQLVNEGYKGIVIVNGKKVVK